MPYLQPLLYPNYLLDDIEFKAHFVNYKPHGMLSSLFGFSVSGFLGFFVFCCLFFSLSFAGSSTVLLNEDPATDRDHHVREAMEGFREPAVR